MKLATKEPRPNSQPFPVRYLAQLVQRTVKEIPTESPPPGLPCYALEPGEFCDGAWHDKQLERQLVSRRCPAARAFAARKPLRELLLKCHVDPDDRSPIAPRLRASLSEARPVEPFLIRVVDGKTIKDAIHLGRAFELIEECAAKMPDRNILFMGKKGTGKTHCQLWLNFHALERAIATEWVDDMRLQRIMTHRRSFDAAVRDPAEQEWQSLLRAQMLFYNDVGADDNAPMRDQPGRPLLAEALRQLLEVGRARFCGSTNLKATELELHRDVGDRSVSRMLAEFQGTPALILKFEGRDQRLVFDF